jgi:hypothetical protein
MCGSVVFAGALVPLDASSERLDQKWPDLLSGAFSVIQLR